MNKLNQWTPFEIEQMKIAFLQGHAVKVIAQKIGRTPTALNKALSRFGIRPRRKNSPVSHATYLRWKRAEYDNSQNLTNNIFNISTSNSPINNSLGESSAIVTRQTFLNRHTVNEVEEIWVKFNLVISFLLGEGCKIQPIKNNTNNYKLDNNVVSREQLLLLANRLRIATNKPIFLVSDVTW